ncbi:hypothetical protein F5141DRAFT_1098332 [Pisolithus sp. B1]|nr:hypothetical protein F5141DRAFT_1098332 [Pisolithus sp. B1]
MLPSSSTELVSSYALIPPSISSLFGKNQVSASEDEQRVHDILRECKSELGGVTDELCRARAEVERIEERLGQIKGVISELEGLLHPIRRMPTDVMAKIFEQSVRDSESQGHSRIDIKQAPLSLSQVCRSWRKLVFALPCLWKRFEIAFPTSSTSPNWYRLMQSQIMFIRLWISRSQSVPVSLSLSLCDYVITSPSLVLLDLEIMRAGPRIRELSLQFPTPSLCRLLSFIQGPLESLEYLNLQTTDTLQSSDSIPPIVLPSAPSLKKLNISSFELDMRRHQVPWVQLTELSLQCRFNTLHSQGNSDYLPILVQCPNLRTCSLGFGRVIGDIDTVTSVTLPHLSTLKVLIYTKTPYLKLFFDALHLPKLRSAKINYVEFPLAADFNETDCLWMLSRAAETVESVSLYHVDVPDFELSSCLSQLSHLKSLRFHPNLPGLHHDLVAMLTVPSSVTRRGDRTLRQRTMCPSLESLDVRCSIDFEPQLRSFSLGLVVPTFERDRGDEMIRMLEARLSSHVDEGLELTIES